MLNPRPLRRRQIRPMADDEIAVDGYVMKPEVRGTSRDPRAVNSAEQWLVKFECSYRSHNPSPSRSRAMGEIARERSGQSQDIAQANIPERFGAAEIE